MNLAQVVQYIKNIALEHPLVKSFYEGDPTVYLNSKEIKYGAFILTQTAFNNIVKEQGIKKYTFDCTYADRLTEDGSNRLVVQTDGINVIHEVFNYIKGNSETSNVPLPITFSTFEQKFADSLAGSFATITLEVEDETGDCDFYYEDILIEPIPGTSHTTILDNYYTKVEVDDLIAGVEAGVMTNYYTKNQTDNKYETIENVDLLEEIVTENTEAIENIQSGKADKADTIEGYGIIDAYTKTEVDDKLDNIEHDNTLNKDGNPNFLHVNEAQKNKLINNYTYKLLNTPVSTWSDSSTYAAYKYESTINIANLIEGDFVLVVFGAMEATNGNYSPIQQQYDGYIKIYSKVDTTITIPTIVVTKILL